MWSLRWGLPSRSRYEHSRLPLNDPSGADAHERYHLHLFLREYIKAIESTTKLTKRSQANSLEVLVIGQALKGVPWGFFIANAPAYASEVVPLALRSACTATL
jgi:hypothetical protein